jgi:PhoPQ-activated pathogenicity-related protein
MLFIAYILFFNLSLLKADLLDDFVNRDPAYVNYEILEKYSYNGTGREPGTKGLSWSSICVNLTSQVWLTDEDWSASWGSKSHWWHYMFITTPSVIKKQGWRSMYITGNSNSEDVPSASSEDLASTAELAMNTGQIFVTLFQVPNFPIQLTNPDGTSTKALGDDDLLAHTFVHYMDYIKNGGSITDLNAASYVVILPMVKSAFAAMKATEDILKDETLPNWTVSGASKRGWTTWLTAAVDANKPETERRVKGIVPIVLDGLNFWETLKLHYGAYGGWSFAMRAFRDVGFTGRIDSEEIKQLWNVIDPYTYVLQGRYAGLPKLVADGVGDEWFLPDDARHWIDAMKENGSPVSLAMYPDADHSMLFAMPALIPSVGSFIENVANGIENPSIHWEMDYENGQIVVSIDNKWGDSMNPHVQMWKTNTCQGDAPRRDFRMINIDKETKGKCPCGPAIPGNDQQCFNMRGTIWSNSTLEVTQEDSNSKLYVAKLDKIPMKIEKRWEAFMVTVTFHDVTKSSSNNDKDRLNVEGGKESCKLHEIAGRKHCLPVVANGDLMMSSQVMILPDYLPASCSGEECLGELL